MVFSIMYIQMVLLLLLGYFECNVGIQIEFARLVASCVVMIASIVSLHVLWNCQCSYRG